LTSRLLAVLLLLAATFFTCACQESVAADPAASTTTADPAARRQAKSLSAAAQDGSKARSGGRQAPGQSPEIRLDPFYGPWERVLSTYVDDEGLVDYAGLASAGRADLETFMQGLASADPARMGDEAEQIAFWINAYNATVLWQVVEAYPLDSVRDVGALWGLVGGFFKKENRIAGEPRSLDEIEHDILRTQYPDPRIHWALVCAAFGCPRLLQRPYLATDLDLVLTGQAFEFVAQDRGLRLDRENDILYLSSYFDWYAEDFEAESGSVIDYLLRYVKADIAEYLRANRDSLKIRFMDYDWTLNDQARGPR
jgi:hypothetical protein